MVTFGNVGLLLLCLFGTFYIYCKRNLNYWKNKGVPHRKPTVPFGNLLEFVFNTNSNSNYFIKLYNEFDTPYVGFYAMTKPYLLVRNPELIKKILIKEFDIFHDRCFYHDKKIDPVMSNTLLSIKGAEWKVVRNKISPVFTSGKLRLMLPLIEECTKHLQAYLVKNLNQNLEMKEICEKYTTDVIMSFAFGLNSNCFEKDCELQTYARLMFPTSLLQLLKTLSYIYAPIFVKIFKYTFVDNAVTLFFRNIFEDTLQNRQFSKVKRNDLIDTLIKIKSEDRREDIFKFDDDVIFAQAYIYFGAAQDTSSSTICYTLHEISVNPEIQEKLRNEIFREIEVHGGATYEAIQNMKYLDMIISETLRKYSVISLISRETVENYTIKETGLLIDKGTPILVSIKALHYDPRYFPNPEKYDPERFSNENKGNIPNHVYIPFGAGPRNCIGQRLGLLTSKLAIVRIIQNFRVERNSETQDPIVFSTKSILKAKHGINLSCTKL